jgi:aryl-alcohol dehydrogenase-like predicted oxidoreductase
VSTDVTAIPTSRGVTPAGSAAFRDAHPDLAAAGHFRVTRYDWVVSSVGLGTYLGDEDDATDALYGEAIVWAVNLGCNLIDSAINYRCQRSERIIGRALDALIREGQIRRDQIVVATKGGYLPFDGRVPADPHRYFQTTYVRSGIIDGAELVAGCHCLAPGYLYDQLRRSLANLALECIDIYYLHNPETQLQEVGREEFLGRIRAAFEFLEAQVDEGRIGGYGVATWNGFRRPANAAEHLSLAELVRVAEGLRGDAHHFRFVQLPYNLAMVEAVALENQTVDGRRTSFLDAAQATGVTVVASASLLQGQLSRLPSSVAEALPGLRTDAQRALQFARSTPGVTTALVGMKSKRHVEENLWVARIAPDPDGARRVLERAG